MGIRDFIELLEEHRARLARGEDLSEEEREETLRESEMMVGMAEGAVKELESVLKNRRVNLPEEHALRFAQDIFRHLVEEEENIKEKFREQG
ncbi:MAG: hypothetical protein M3475_01980 [Actinomycetota bacterium]|nr:hypothetical protein [Actinomycetota bacterium]